MAGAPYDWKAPDEWTPLIGAAAFGHHEVVELLLAKGSIDFGHILYHQLSLVG